MEFYRGRGGAWTLTVKEDDQKEEGGPLDFIRGVKKHIKKFSLIFHW
jgi:hypothetical protein